MQTAPTYRSQDLADSLGISYRMLDYLTRSGAITDPALSPSSGRYRVWTADVAVRLHVAKALSDAAPYLRFGDVAKSVCACPVLPPAKGLAILRRDGTVEYADNPVTLVAALGDGGVVADYELPHAA